MRFRACLCVCVDGGIGVERKHEREGRSAGVTTPKRERKRRRRWESGEKKEGGGRRGRFIADPRPFSSWADFFEKARLLTQRFSFFASEVGELWDEEHLRKRGGRNK